MTIIRWTLALLVLLVGLAFHLRNRQAVIIDYYFGSQELPLSIALALALIGGAALGILSGLPLWLRLQGHKWRRARVERTGTSPSRKA